METRPRTEPIDKAVVHVNVGPETSRTSAEALVAWLQNVPQGYHQVTDDDSAAFAAADDLVVQGASGMNARGVHVCIIGRADQTRAQWLDTFSRAAIKNAAKVIAGWCKKHGLPVKHLTPQEVARDGVKGICGHDDVNNSGRPGTIPVNQGGHYDPGPNFPWDVLLADVNAILNPPEPEDHSVKPNDKIDVKVSGAGGIYIAQADGGVFVSGTGGRFHGSHPSLVNQGKAKPLVMGVNECVGLALAPNELGYWLGLYDGGVETFQSGGVTYNGNFLDACKGDAYLVGILSDGKGSYYGVRSDGAKLLPKK